MSGRARSTKFWMLLLGALLLVSAVASVLLLRARGGSVARVYQDGALLYTIALDEVDAPYTLTVEGAVTNVLYIEPGRICVGRSSCPDQVCVHQGWISNGVVPVVCLPNGLVIRIEGETGELDTVAG